MPLTHFRIVSGTPGTDRALIRERLEVFVSRLHVGERPASVRIRTVEEFIVELCPSDWYVPDKGKDPLLVILARRPQDQVRQVWQEAFVRAAEEALAGGPDLAVVFTSLSYYRKETYEFYCPADLKWMRDWLDERTKDNNIASVGPILTLIDDIYDLYYRLSRPGHVFDVRQLVEDKLEANEGSEHARYRKAMSLVIQSLIRVLEWRESEIQAAASLGSVWAVPSLTLAVKHPVETAVRLLLGESSASFGLGRTLPVYLSHPISAPRKANAATGNWPRFVEEFDEFVSLVRQSAVEDLHITPIMPTAIDEFRFLTDGDKLLPRLAPRWPLPGEGAARGRDELLYCADAGHPSYAAYEQQCLQSIFDPPLDNEGARVGSPHGSDGVRGMLVGDAVISGMLRTLESLITLQMANRDHMLVRQCPGFLLYRPLSDEKPRFTGGVRAEIRDQNQLRKFENPRQTFARPMVFIHSADDVKRFFTPEPDGKERGEAVKHVSQEMVKVAKEMVVLREDDTFGEPAPSTLATALSDPGDPQGYIESIHKQVCRSESGPIGYMDAASLEATKGQFRAALIRERTRLLACTRPTTEWEWRYVFVNADGSKDLDEPKPQKDTPPVIAVGVFAELASSAEAMKRSVAFVSEHFAARVRAETSPPGKAT